MIPAPNASTTLTTSEITWSKLMPKSMLLAGLDGGQDDVALNQARRLREHLGGGLATRKPARCPAALSATTGWSANQASHRRFRVDASVWADATHAAGLDENRSSLPTVRSLRFRISGRLEFCGSAAVTSPMAW